MDREKVIKGLKLCAIGSECAGRDCPYWHNVLDDAAKGCDCTTELIRDAIALLKEQEAVEPILELGFMVCGVCGHEVIWQKMLGDGIWVDEELDYCPHCGQAVKWK